MSGWLIISHFLSLNELKISIEDLPNTFWASKRPKDRFVVKFYCARGRWNQWWSTQRNLHKNRLTQWFKVSRQGEDVKTMDTVLRGWEWDAAENRLIGPICKWTGDGTETRSMMFCAMISGWSTEHSAKKSVVNWKDNDWLISVVIFVARRHKWHSHAIISSLRRLD